MFLLILDANGTFCVSVVQLRVSTDLAISLIENMECMALA